MGGWLQPVRDFAITAIVGGDGAAYVFRASRAQWRVKMSLGESAAPAPYQRLLSLAQPYDPKTAQSKGYG